MSEQINIDQLITHVRNHPELWDLSNLHYTDLNRKEQIWKTIASKLGFPVAQVKKRWDGLRAGYRTFLRRKELSKYSFKWHMEDKLSFLHEQIMKLREHRAALFNKTVSKSELYKSDKRLISVVRQFPELWDRKTGTNMELKQIGWQKIADQLGKPVDEVKLRWKQLRCNYTRALESKKKWPLGDDMAFLKEQIRRHRRRFMSNETFVDECSSLDDTEVNYSVVDIKMEDDTTYYFENLNEENSSNAFEATESSCDNMQDEDGTDNIEQFFLSLFKTVVTLPPLVQAKLKAEIFETVNAAEMEFLEANVNCACQGG